MECKRIRHNGTCLRSCFGELNLYTIPNEDRCGHCHPECKQSCTGPADSDCFECKHVKYGNHCVAECPRSKYALNGTCFDCHEQCTACTGPLNTFGENGCKACDKVMISENKIEKCLKKDEECPGKLFYYFIYFS